MKNERITIHTIVLPFISLFALYSLPAFGQAAGGVDPVVKEGTDMYTASLAALTQLFVLAVLIESALSLIFNWRVFLTFFNKRAIKTIVMFVVSLIVVRTFDIDIVANLMKVYDPKSNPGDTMSMILTALILAGGSSGVNNVFVALGFRSRIGAKPPEPPQDEAWGAILVNRREVARGEILVQVSEEPSGATADNPGVAGSINARKRLKDVFFPNQNRFPTSGGYRVEAGKVYRISVTGEDESGNAVPRLGGTYSFAPRAIVDLEVTL